MMKELKPTNLWAVEVPIGIVNFCLSYRDIDMEWIEYPDKTGCTKIPIPKGKYVILGEVTKDNADFDVDLFIEKELKSVGYVYLDYLQPESIKRPYKFDDAQQSFYSLLTANGIYFENPIEKPNGEDYYESRQLSFDQVDSVFNLELYDEDLSKWKSFENALIKGKLLIIEKIK